MTAWRDAAGIRRRLTVPGLLVLVAAGLGGPAWASPPEARTTFHSIGIYWKPESGSARDTCSVIYRPAATHDPWRPALPLWFDRRVHTEAPARSREYRGSIVGLTPGTTYDIRLRLASGLEANLSARTWSDSPPIDRTVVLAPGISTRRLVITEGGSADRGYVLYHASGHTVDTGTRARSSVLVQASYIILQGLTVRGGAEHGLILGDVNHVIIEACDISGWGSKRPGSSWGQDLNSAIFSESPELEHIVVQGSRLHHPRTDANSWLEPEGHDNHPQGPQGISFIDSRGGHVIRYNEIFSDDGHRFNDGMGGWHNFGYGGFPNRDSDIYGNLVSHCWDDAIEVEGACMNVRVWGNYVTHTYMGFGLATTSLGPNYVWRNVVARSQRGPEGTDPSRYSRGGAFFKVGGPDANLASGPIYLFHNTAWQPPPEPPREMWPGVEAGILVTSARNHLLNLTSRNNILQVRNHPDYYSILVTNPDPSNTFDGDLYNGKVEGSPGAEAHGLRLGLSESGRYDPANGEGEFFPGPDSPALDAGVTIPNFSDGFVGAAPDIGAFERGGPPLRFGRRASAGGATAVEAPGPTGAGVPAGLSLVAYPNPFNGHTRLTFVRPTGGPARISIYNLFGQEVITLTAPGRGKSDSVTWDGRDRDGRALGSGLYLGVLRVAGRFVSRKLLLLR